MLLAVGAGSGALGRMLVGRGGCGAVRARRVFDTRSAGRAPPIAGRGGGPGARGRVGEHQGGRGQLQDKVGCCFAAGLEQDGMVVAISMP